MGNSWLVKLSSGIRVLCCWYLAFLYGVGLRLAKRLITPNQFWAPIWLEWTAIIFFPTFSFKRKIRIVLRIKGNVFHQLCIPKSSAYLWLDLPHKSAVLFFPLNYLLLLLSIANSFSTHKIKRQKNLGNHFKKAVLL